ncbi:MAG: hypothetical protein WCH11_00205 [Bdellovibrio sp.]
MEKKICKNNSCNQNFFAFELSWALGAFLIFIFSLGAGSSESAWGDPQTERFPSDLENFSTDDLISFAQDLESKWRQVDPGFSTHSRKHWRSRVSSKPIGYVPEESPERQEELEEMRQQSRLDHFSTPAQFVNFFRTENSQILRSGKSMLVRKKFRALGISLMSPGFQPLFSFGEAIEANHHKDLIALELGREPFRLEFLIDPQMAPLDRVLLTHRMLQESLEKLKTLMAHEIFIILPRYDFFARATLEFYLAESEWKKNSQFREILREEDRLFARRFLAYQAPRRIVTPIKKLSPLGQKVIFDSAFREMDQHLGPPPSTKGSAMLNLIFTTRPKGVDSLENPAPPPTLAMELASQKFLRKILETSVPGKRCNQWRHLF